MSKARPALLFAERHLLKDFGSGEVSPRDALAQKGKLFAEIQGECQAITPAPKSFNRCLSANNNAGLAFDMTYAKYYPLMYEVYLACGQDLKATMQATKKALAAGSEPEALRQLQELICTLHSSPP